MEIPKIHESEYRFCLIMWEHEPVTAVELVKLCQDQLGWKRTTTYTVIKRLGERGVLKNDNGTVTSLVSKDDAQACEIDELVEKKFEGSLPAFIAAFTKHQAMSELTASGKEVHNERTLFENHQHEHIGKLAYPGCADTQACFEESSQVGQCSALGYRGCQIDLPALF